MGWEKKEKVELPGISNSSGGARLDRLRTSYIMTSRVRMSRPRAVRDVQKGRMKRQEGLLCLFMRSLLYFRFKK